MNRSECLDTAKEIITKDRNNQYGEPENNFATIAAFWSEYLKKKLKSDIYITDIDVAVMMSLFKIGRMTDYNFKDDSFVDAIGYLACGSELFANRCLKDIEESYKSYDDIFSTMAERRKNTSTECFESSTSV